MSFQSNFVQPGQSKINTRKWNGFVRDLKEESGTFQMVLDQAKNDHQDANVKYKECAQLSFNSIHNVKRQKPPEEHMIPRVPHPKPKPMEKSKTQFEYDTKVSNHSSWPKRTTSAMRLFHPKKLDTIYSVKPKPRDTFVLTGAFLTEDEIF